jgi:carbamoyl-phosphate synthase large subunit
MAGGADGFADDLLARSRDAGIQVLIPTVDAELLPISGYRERFDDAGVRLALTGEEALRHTHDKLDLMHRCASTVHTPRTELLGPDLDVGSWTYPVIVKPRSGGDSHGMVVVGSAADLAGIAHDDQRLVQEFLPGEEFSLDVFADLDAAVVSVVPRTRLRVDSGVSVAGRTLHDPELDALGRGVVAALGLTLVSNVRCRRDANGRATLLAVNPRFPGAMPLTVHSGVDMPRLCLDAMLGRQLPVSLPHSDETMVRYLDERFISAADTDNHVVPTPARVATPAHAEVPV